MLGQKVQAENSQRYKHLLYRRNKKSTLMQIYARTTSSFSSTTRMIWRTIVIN